MKKENKSSNLLAYLGIFILFLFIALPPALRVFIPKEENTTDPDINVVKMQLTCTKVSRKIEYNINEKIITTYRDGAISTSTFIYDVEIKEEGMTISGIEIDEFNELRKIPGVISKQEGNTYTINIDYQNNDYSSEEILKNHSNTIQEQMTYYTTEDRYTCITERN